MNGIDAMKPNCRRHFPAERCDAGGSNLHSCCLPSGHRTQADHPLYGMYSDVHICGCGVIEKKAKAKT